MLDCSEPCSPHIPQDILVNVRALFSIFIYFPVEEFGLTKENHHAQGHPNVNTQHKSRSLYNCVLILR